MTPIPPAALPMLKSARVEVRRTVPKLSESELPESELPPERQPLNLPPDYDATKYPHYSVQSSIYSLLLSALTMAEHYERWPGAEARKCILDHAICEYQKTCDPCKMYPK